MKTNLKIPLFITFSFFLYIFVLNNYLEICPYGIRVNRSNSLPHKIYISSSIQVVNRGMYVSFKHPEASMNLAKRLIGLPGDMIQMINDHIYVNDTDCGAVLRVSQSGREFTPISTGIIPEGYAFVSATHEKSFDSRYAEFGLIRLDALEEELWPIF